MCQQIYIFYYMFKIMLYFIIEEGWIHQFLFCFVFNP